MRMFSAWTRLYENVFKCKGMYENMDECCTMYWNVEGCKWKYEYVGILECMKMLLGYVKNYGWMQKNIWDYRWMLYEKVLKLYKNCFWAFIQLTLNILSGIGPALYQHIKTQILLVQIQILNKLQKQPFYLKFRFIYWCKGKPILSKQKLFLVSAMIKAQ